MVPFYPVKFCISKTVVKIGLWLFICQIFTVQWIAMVTKNQIIIDYFQNIGNPGKCTLVFSWKRGRYSGFTSLLCSVRLYILIRQLQRKHEFRADALGTDHIDILTVGVDDLLNDGKT